MFWLNRPSEGYFTASVPELPDCVAEAETRSDAIA
ncbi:type II toxin-antitoxin system HicB family antitoxin [Nostoc sp.]